MQFSFVNPLWDRHDISIQSTRNHYSVEPRKAKESPDAG